VRKPRQTYRLSAPLPAGASSETATYGFGDVGVVEIADNAVGVIGPVVDKGVVGNGRRNLEREMPSALGTAANMWKARRGA
jgi:hypothetical protein